MAGRVLLLVLVRGPFVKTVYRGLERENAYCEKNMHGFKSVFEPQQTYLLKNVYLLIFHLLDRQCVCVYVCV